MHGRRGEKSLVKYIACHAGYASAQGASLSSETSVLMFAEEHNIAKTRELVCAVLRGSAAGAGGARARSAALDGRAASARLQTRVGASPGPQLRVGHP